MATSVSESARRLRDSLARVPRDVFERHVAAAEVVDLPAQVPPWTVTGVALAEGDSFTLFAEGRVVLSEEAGLWNGAALHLWARVGGRGPLLNGTRDTYGFRAPSSGALELGIYQGEWRNEDGDLDTPRELYEALGGGLAVLVVRWRGEARAGVEALARAVPEEPLFAAESARLARPIEKPAGWEYLWFLGPADIYRAARFDGTAAISAETRDDVGILRRPVRVPLRDDTRLRWRWRVHDLPSAVAEDQLVTHDYLSIALELDNGQDLTWYWSSTLPAETCFRCPLPHWDQRETHLVVRSGASGIGKWHDEERSVVRDYETAVRTDAPPPREIVAVWLIAVSVFQKRSGAVDFAAIEIASEAGRTVVL